METQPAFKNAVSVISHSETDGSKAVEEIPPSDAAVETAGSATNEEKHEYVTGFKLLIVMISVILVGFLVMLDIAIIATAIPRITSDFHSLSDVGWYGSAYLIAGCSLQPLTGKLYTHFRTKYTFLIFLALFELGSLLCGVATSSKMLIIGRAVAGLGSSGLSNGTLTIISVCLPLARRPFYFGIVLSIAQLGIVLGPLIGGALTQYATWRWCFYINLPVGGAAIILLLLIAIPDRILKDASEQKPTLLGALAKLDLLGFALFAPAAAQFLLAIEWGGTEYSWSSSTIIGLFCGSASTLAIFLAWEYHRGDTAMIPLSMVAKRIVATSCGVIFFYFGASLTVSYYLPIYFQAVRGVTPTLSGVSTMPTILSQIVAAILSGYLVSKLGYYILWSALSGVLMPIGIGLLSTFTPQTSTAVWIGFQIIAGAGRGVGLQMPIVAIQNFLPQEQVSIGLALIIFSQTLGGALFLSFAETVLTNGLAQALLTYAPEINPQTVIQAGATAWQDVVPSASVDGVLLAYNQAISHVFYLATGAAVAIFVVCWGMGWKGAKKEEVAGVDEKK